MKRVICDSKLFKMIIYGEYYYITERNGGIYTVFELDKKYIGDYYSVNFISELEYRDRLIKEILE